MRIIVVEDNPDIRECLELILSDSGYSVMTFASPEGIFAAIEEHKPDLILMDVMLEGHDGRDICKAIKANRITGSIPVIIISATEGVEKTLADCCASDFVAKPFDIDLLLSKIRSHLSVSN